MIPANVVMLILILITSLQFPTNVQLTLSINVLAKFVLLIKISWKYAHVQGQKINILYIESSRYFILNEIELN